MKVPGIRVVKIESPSVRKGAYALREDVFIQEQEVDRDEEFDEFDETATHFAAINEWGEVVGTSRWRPTEQGIKLERFAVRKDMRKSGIGSLLVEATLDDIRAHEGTGSYVYLHAQLTAVPLYAKYGFEKKGEEFIECDIRHQTMFRYT